MKRITKALEICSPGPSMHHDTCAASQIFENRFPMDRFKGFVVGNQGFYAKSIDHRDFKGDFSLQIDRWPNLPCSSYRSFVRGSRQVTWDPTSCLEGDIGDIGLGWLVIL